MQHTLTQSVLLMVRHLNDNLSSKANECMRWWWSCYMRKRFVNHFFHNSATRAEKVCVCVWGWKRCCKPSIFQCIYTQQAADSIYVNARKHARIINWPNFIFDIFLGSIVRFLLVHTHYTYVNAVAINLKISI